MLLDTHISMPSQDPLAENKFSLAPKDLRKWLKNLPYVDQDLAISQFYHGLKCSNRQSHSTKQRLTAIEIIRPTAHEFLIQQRKYLLAQPFPLPKKANEVLKLQQNILNELAVAYKIIIQETVNRDSILSNKKLVICVHHAIYYQVEQYITLAQVYSEPPQSFWKDLCQIYSVAEHFDLTDIQIKNVIDEINPKSSPKMLFTQACLLSLANLHTYGHGEAGKIANYLNQACNKICLTDTLPKESKYIFYINLALAKPVRLMQDEEIPISSKNRYIDASILIDELKELTTSTQSDTHVTLEPVTKLNSSLSKRLLRKLSSKPVRASKRAVPPKGRLHIVIGLRDAFEVLQSGNIFTDQTSEHNTENKTNLELMPIENRRSNKFVNLNSDQEDDLYQVSGANAWDWISRGNVITEKHSSTKNNNSGQQKNEKVVLNPVVQTWDISNASKGGYCLNSHNTSDYQSQVGDIILLRLDDKPNDEWRLGVIRWMQSLSAKGVKIGIETLHGKVQMFEVVDAHQSCERLMGFEYVLQISEKTRSGTNKSIITPPNAATSGDSLILQKDQKRQNVVLQHRIEQTISYAKFSYSEVPDMPSGDVI